MRNRQIALMNPGRMLDDSFFDGLFPRSFVDYHPNELDMSEDENNFYVKVKAPGFKEEDLDINIEDNVLTISGTTSEESEEEDKKRKYYYKEIRNESFSRSVSLPTRVKTDKAEAQVKNGVLEIKMPKAEEVKPKRISIKPGK